MHEGEQNSFIIIGSPADAHSDYRTKKGATEKSGYQRLNMWSVFAKSVLQLINSSIGIYFSF